MTAPSQPQKPSKRQVTTATRPIDRLLDIMAYLRTHAEGCPWTKEQTHRSLVPYLIEESYETADMIDQGQHDAPRKAYAVAYKNTR